MNINLTILGTASAMPVSDRNPSAQALSVHGRLFLIDCGEGTQQQLRRSHLSFLKIEALFISHLHGDHCFGVFGLFSTMAMYGRTQALDVFAPAAFAPILEFYQTNFCDAPAFEIKFHPIAPTERTEIAEYKRVKVSAFPLEHKTDCYGFRFDEILTPRQLEAGRLPASYAYVSDTHPFDALSDYVKGVSVLYHESTYTEQYAEKAESYAHSTAAQAAKCALDSGVGKLILGHYTSRERDNSVFEDEARTIFSDSFAARDGDVFEIDYIRKV